LNIVLVGREQEIADAMSRSGVKNSSRLSVQHAPDVLSIDAKPKEALRHGKESSMWKALQMQSEGLADASVSGGSTAALMTLGVKLVGLLPGIQRPALMARVPGAGGHTCMLDLGANVDVSPRQLIQFAVMGSVTAQYADRIDQPRVGLLNVGHEDSKGSELVREAHQQLKLLPLNYIGFIEGNDIFSGRVDVAICDGFAGNLILKSSEGLVRFLVAQLRQSLNSDLRSRMGGLLAKPAVSRMLAQLDPSEHNGAPLLGLKSVVIKSHGGADCKAMTQAILEAGREARRQVPEKINGAMQAIQLETDT
jgi:glycerol-3-phosphate acyltransferase PlsX